MDINEIRQQVRRRLNKQQLKAARYGIGVDPQVSMDTEDLERLLTLLDTGTPAQIIKLYNAIFDDAITEVYGV